MTTNSKYYEGCGMEGPIRCIFLSEFHPTAGSKINCQVKSKFRSDFIINFSITFKAPEGYVAKEIFDAINVYIIPKPQLQRCILTV